MLSGYHRQVIPINITDPGADKRVPLLKVPTGHTYTVEAATIVADTTTAAATDNYFSATLENGGTAGTAQTAISSACGGTEGWTANTPKAVTITAGAGDLTAGQYLNLAYDESGTVAPGRLTVILEVVDGVGAKA